MNCTFCNTKTDERFKRGKVILIAHFWCLEDRLNELNTDDLRDCLLYEDQVRNYGETRSV